MVVGVAAAAAVVVVLAPNDKIQVPIKRSGSKLLWLTFKSIEPLDVVVDDVTVVVVGGGDDVTVVIVVVLNSCELNKACLRAIQA